MPLFHDLASVSSRTDTPEGFLAVVADFARPGVQTYFAAELPFDQLPPEFQKDKYRKVKLLRSEDEVFDPASMKSFARKSVTDFHPPEFVNVDNWRDHQIGMTDSQIIRQNNKLRAPLLIQDPKAIAAVKAGKDQVSAGYESELVWDSGVDPVYGPYDAKQTQIRGNHIAIVEVARGGPAIRINDSWPNIDGTTPPPKGDKAPMPDVKLVSRKVNGITVDFTDQGAQVLDGILERLGQVEGETAALKTQLADAEKKRDELQGQLDAEKKNQITDEQVEAKAVERTELVDQARQLHPELDPKGKSLAAIKSEAIQHVDSSFVLDGKSDEYLDGVFGALYARREDKSTASMRDAGKGAGKTGVNDSPAVTAREDYLARGNDAWKGAQS